MPFEVEPIGYRAPVERARISPDWNWIAQQDFSRDQAWGQIGQLRPGTRRGGPTSAQYDLLDNPRKYSIYAHAPLITDPAKTAQAAFGKFGTVTLSEIDPFLTIESLGQGIGFSQQQAQGASTAAKTFLGERDIDPFGQGASGVPSRLADYAVGLLTSLYDQSTGKPIPMIPQPTGDSVFKYDFQRDPAYGALVAADGATDEFLHGVAERIASRYPTNSSYLAEQLFAQFKADRGVLRGESSGDRTIDYQAKVAFTVDYINERTGAPAAPAGPFRKGVSSQPYQYYQGKAPMSPEANTAALMVMPSAIAGVIPFVGSDIREGIYQHPQQIEDAWAKLSNEQRQVYFGRAGLQGLVGDAVVWLPLMSGAGAVAAIAQAPKAGTTLRTAFKAYEYGRNVTVSVMATGLSVATLNWGLSWAVPGYAEDFGKRLDYARPVSSSAIAGLFNQMGFFASGTFGANLAVRGTIRAGEKITGKASRILGRAPGTQELGYHRFVYGGSAMRRELAATGIDDPGLLDLAPRSGFTSHISNWLESNRRAIAEAYAKGHPTGIAKYDNITDPALRLEAANDMLLRGISGFGNEAEGIVKVMMEARRSRPLFSGIAQRMHDSAVKTARYVDDEMARVHMEEYGQAWITRTVGSYDRAAMEAYARATITRLGGDANRLGKHNEEGWAQALRYLHQVEYHQQNGLLQLAAEGSEEAPRLLLMQADHLFADEADRILKVLDGGDEALAASTVADAIASRREAAAWFANEWNPAQGVAKRPETVKAAEFANWLREVRSALPHRRALPDPASSTAGLPLNHFHAELEERGLWTLGFKATDEEGNAISYVQRPNGRVFKSPWIDYPMGNQEAIDLGNRGLLRSKADGITRGFRTWRIVEFQKGLLYRRLTTRLPGVSPEQIERFHSGVMRLARETGAQPQTLGAVARARSPIIGAGLVAEKLDKIVEDVFGAGPHLSPVTGKAINFYDEIAKSYRQGFRLNLAAGLTSFLKANLGEVGSQLSWFSDIGYVMWRFNMSGIFKGGELLESGLFNPMRGAFGIDEVTKSLYRTAGVGADFAPLAAEMNYDDIARSLANKAAATDPSSRLAASAGFYARGLPEDFEQAAKTAYAQRTASDMRATHLGGQLPSAGWLPERGEGRVVTAEQIPADFSTKLADHRPDHLNADELADEQEIWHATTSLERIYADGLKARAEQNLTLARPDLPAMGEGFKVWRDRARDLPPPPAGQGRYYVRFSDNELDDFASGGVKPGGLLDAKHALVDDPDLLLGGRNGAIVELDAKYVNLVDEEIDWGARNRVWTWDEKTGDYVLDYTSPYVAALAPQGLGGGFGRNVSTTFNHEHALEIARRLKFASQAARNEVGNAEILEHFAEWYGDDYYSMGKILGATPLSVSENYQGGILKLSTKGAPPPRVAGSIDTFDELVAWMDTRGLYKSGAAKYSAVVDLDNGLRRYGANEDGTFSGSVILAGSVEDMARLNPDEIGVVRVAARKGAIANDGDDLFELEFKSDDLLVVDDRVTLAPLADDTEGLLAQLKETLAAEPKAGQLSVTDHLVGGNGIAPGLEGRARSILTKLEDLEEAKLDGGPVFNWLDQTPEAREAFRATLRGEGWEVNPSASMAIQRRMDGTTRERLIGDLYEERQRRAGATTRLEDVAGTQEAFGEALDNLIEEKGKTRRDWRETFWHPTPYKLEKTTELQIKLARDEFPGLLRVSGNAGIVRVFEGLGLKESRWLDWLVEDRRLLAKWDDSRSAADFDKLLAHAGDDARASFNELYASEGWASLSALIGANFRSAGQEAFGVHFFSPYRSALERSINHPLLGLYPASWSIKAAREWAKFLFDNEMLGINIGMAPAQALAQVIHDQHAAFAGMTGEDLDTWLSNEGPLGAPIFIFNLLMPGDWSALPFALSRPIRDYSRAILGGDTMPDAGSLLTRSIWDYGVTRDIRLLAETAGQMGDLLGLGGEADDPARALTKYSVRGGDWLTYDPPAMDH